MEKDDGAYIRAENARLSSLVAELMEEVHNLQHSDPVGTLNPNPGIDRLSNFALLKRKAFPWVDESGKKRKKEKLTFSGHDIGETLVIESSSIANVDPSMRCTSQDSDLVADMESKTCVQMVEGDETEGWKENARLNFRIAELWEEIRQLTEVTFAEILKSTSEIESQLKTQLNGGNDDEARMIIRIEKARVFRNLPNYRLRFEPDHFSLDETSIVDCLRKKVTKAKMPFQKIYEVENIFKMHPEMLAEELPPDWYFFTRPGGLINRQDPFKKALISGIWRQYGRVREVKSYDPVDCYDRIGTKRIYVCESWRLTLYRLLLSVEAESQMKYETGWAFAIMEKGKIRAKKVYDESVCVVDLGGRLEKGKIRAKKR